jgi:hypothetical protein
MTLDKVGYPVLPHRPFYYLFCKISDNLAYRGDMPIIRGSNLRYEVLSSIADTVKVTAI